jgi:hypothetical protein
MASSIAMVPKKEMALHCAALREYAGRVVARGEELTPCESDDQAERMREFLAMGSSFRLTYKEIVRLIYDGLFSEKRGCDCPGCAARKAR